jgi:SAM-dependent methyltransferase
MIGSEFLGDSVPRGSKNVNGIFNQDLTSLSFSDESLDVVLSFDCFEHMPDFDLGMREVARVLKPGGRMMWSVPFRSDLDSNLVRATHSEDGQILHHEPPEYHGDPVNTAGCLCYTHFGWQMLEQMKNCGYSKAYAVAYWSDVFGYLGTENFIFVAIK